MEERERVPADATIDAAGFDSLRPRRREFLAGAAGTAAVLGLSSFAAACGSDSGSSSGGDKITFGTMPYPVEPAKWQAFQKSTMAKFKKETGITVDWTTLVAQSFFQKWSLAMSKGTPPDVGDMFYLQSRVLQGKGKWGPVDLTERVEKGEFGNWDRFPPVAQREAKYEGKIYGVPWRIAAFPFVYNSALVPTAPTSIEDFEQVSADLFAKGGLKAGSTTWGQPYFQINAPAAVWGIEALTADLKKSALDDPRWLESMTWVQDMVSKNVLYKEAGIDAPTGVSFDTVLRGQVGSAFNGDSSIMAAAEGTAPDMVKKLKSAPTPIGPTGKSTSIASSAQFAVFENSKAIDAGIEWIKYLIKPEVVAEMCKVTGQGPADIEVQDVLATPFTKPFYEASRTALGIDLPTPAWSELTAQPDGPLTELTRSVFAGRDVQEALGTANDKVNEILSKYP